AHHDHVIRVIDLAGNVDDLDVHGLSIEAGLGDRQGELPRCRELLGAPRAHLGELRCLLCLRLSHLAPVTGAAAPTAAWRPPALLQARSGASGSRRSRAPRAARTASSSLTDLPLTARD